MASRTRSKPSFGQTIVSLRRERGLNQKELASKIRREDSSDPISPSYLNDIEHDRRNPTSDHLIQQIADALSVDAAFLTFLAGQLPTEMRELALDEEQLQRAIKAFKAAVQS